MNNHLPTISIITINLNNSIGLNRTLESINGLKFREFELIVIDGNSSDGSQDICGKYNFLINHFVSENDRGIYHAMNKALKLSEGQGNIFLNAGDIFSGQILSNNLVIPSLIDVYFKNIISKKFKKKNYTFYKNLIYSNKK